MTMATNLDPSRTEVKRAILSLSRFHNKTSLDSIAKHLRSIRARGKLVIDFSDGSPNAITFEARHELNGSDHIEVQFKNP